ncbi:glycosyltransferase [Streptomyces narbonensis]
MNVYMVELSRALAELGVEVDLFTRCRGEGLPPLVELFRGSGSAICTPGPRGPLPKEAMPDLVVPFSLALLKEDRRYDLVHSHYWLSGQAGRIASVGWRVPLRAHRPHPGPGEERLARRGRRPRTRAPRPRRAPGRRLHQPAIAKRMSEAEALRTLLGRRRADRGRPPGSTCGPSAHRRRPGRRRGPPRPAGRMPWSPLYAGRIQPLKGPDVLVRAVAELLRRSRGCVTASWCGWWAATRARPGRGTAWKLAGELGVTDVLGLSSRTAGAVGGAGTGRRTCWWCPRAASPSVWWHWRRKRMRDSGARGGGRRSADGGMGRGDGAPGARPRPGGVRAAAAVVHGAPGGGPGQWGRRRSVTRGV